MYIGAKQHTVPNCYFATIKDSTCKVAVKVFANVYVVPLQVQVMRWVRSPTCVSKQKGSMQKCNRN